MSNFSFSHSICYLCGELATIFIKFEIVVFKLFQFERVKFITWERVNRLPQQQILDSSKLKEFADDNFKFDENGRKLSKRVKALWEKEKLLVMSNFSFSHSVFKRLVSQGCQKMSLCGKGLMKLLDCITLLDIYQVGRFLTDLVDFGFRVHWMNFIPLSLLTVASLAWKEYCMKY